MTARISLIPEETRGHRPRLQLRDFDCLVQSPSSAVGQYNLKLFQLLLRL